MPGFPDNQFRIVPGRIRSEERLPEAGTEGKGSRTVWALRAEVLPGQSGGPVVDVRGNVVGMVVLNSRTHPDLAYALTRAELSEVWAVGRHKAPGREPRCR